jgi:hypothetical protein
MRGNEAMMISIDRPSFNRRLEFDSIDAVLKFVETEDVLWQWTNATTIPATLQFAAENYRGGKWMARVRTDAEALKANPTRRPTSRDEMNSKNLNLSSKASKQRLRSRWNCKGRLDTGNCGLYKTGRAQTVHFSSWCHMELPRSRACITSRTRPRVTCLPPAPRFRMPLFSKPRPSRSL